MMDECDSAIGNQAEEPISFVEQELQTLQSIYINEIRVKKDNGETTSVTIDLHPATADNLDEQYVKMTLEFTLSAKYPQTLPDIQIRNPRGLSEEKLNGIAQDLHLIAESKVGNSMLFEIIEAAKEYLTKDNIPCGECGICLYGFDEDDVFTKTECYHYFHSHCLARYSKNATRAEDNETDNDSLEEELLCPLCRLPIRFEGSEDLYPPPTAGEDDLIVSEEMLEMQKKMADLYQKQVNQGGIIDIEAERNKYLLEISNVPTRMSSVEKSTKSGYDEDPPKTQDSASNLSEKDKNRDDPKSDNFKSNDKAKSVRFEKKNKQARENTNTNSARISDNLQTHPDKSRFRDELNLENKNVKSPEIGGENLYQDETSKTNAEAGTGTFSYKRNDHRKNNFNKPRQYNDRSDNMNHYGDSGNYQGRRYAYGKQNDRPGYMNRYGNSNSGYDQRGRYGSNGYGRQNFRERGHLHQLDGE